MYGTVIRETGWSVRKLERQPVADVFDLLWHIGENPPAYIILGAVHIPQKPRASNEKETLEGFHEIAQMLGVAPQPIPEALGAQLAEIEKLSAAMNKKHLVN